ncbi:MULTISPECIES: hypothetical protein [unclassified Haladaptatus]|uniref:hypothetical protein n=1 Tax=unclassified Haladaptatus TaxID=2622732 RepID=UPI0023E773D5|nr:MULTISPECIES: hypothetical protein [unclassified Haladaptatus]
MASGTFGWAVWALFLVLSVLLLWEDALVWLREGTVPGIEFFLVGLVSLGLLFVLLREMPLPVKRRP